MAGFVRPVDSPKLVQTLPGRLAISRGAVVFCGAMVGHRDCLLWPGGRTINGASPRSTSASMSGILLYSPSLLAKEQGTVAAVQISARPDHEQPTEPPGRRNQQDSEKYASHQPDRRGRYDRCVGRRRHSDLGANEPTRSRLARSPPPTNISVRRERTGHPKRALMGQAPGEVRAPIANERAEPKRRFLR